MFGMLPQAVTAPGMFGGGDFAPPKKKGGFFGGDLDVNPKLAALSQIFASLGRSKVSPAFQLALMQKRREQQLQDAETNRQNAMRDFYAKKQWEMANPQPTEYERNYDYIARTQGPEAANTYIGNKIDPPVWRQGADGRFYRVDNVQPSPAQGITEDQWNAGTPYNGGGATSPGNFRR